MLLNQETLSHVVGPVNSVMCCGTERGNCQVLLNQKTLSRVVNQEALSRVVNQETLSCVVNQETITCF